MNSPGWSGAFAAQPGVRVRSDGSTLKGSIQNPVARWSVSWVNPCRVGSARPTHLGFRLAARSTHGYSNGSPSGDDELIQDLGLSLGLQS
jgi:hypothetical protein